MSQRGTVWKWPLYRRLPGATPDSTTRLIIHHAGIHGITHPVRYPAWPCAPSRAQRTPTGQALSPPVYRAAGGFASAVWKGILTGCCTSWPPPPRPAGKVSGNGHSRCRQMPVPVRPLSEYQRPAGSSPPDCRLTVAAGKDRLVAYQSRTKRSSRQ